MGETSKTSIYIYDITLKLQTSNNIYIYTHVSLDI